MKIVRVRTATIPHASRARGSQRSGKRVSAALPESTLTLVCVAVSRGSCIYFYSILVQNSKKNGKTAKRGFHLPTILPHIRNASSTKCQVWMILLRICFSYFLLQQETFSTQISVLIEVCCRQCLPVSEK